VSLDFHEIGIVPRCTPAIMLQIYIQRLHQYIPISIQTTTKYARTVIHADVVTPSANNLWNANQFLYPGINLRNKVIPAVRGPVFTSLIYTRRHVHRRDVIRTLQKIHIQTGTDVPGQVTMERPDAGVVQDEIDHHVPDSNALHTGLEYMGVSPHGVVEADGAVPLAQPFGNNPEVVSVKVHGVLAQVGHAVIIEDDPDRGVGSQVVREPVWIWV
jgi:hypothetical protein